MDPCSYCGKPYKRDDPHTADHIEPRSQLTEECNWDNFIGACKHCNNIKGDMPLWQFIHIQREKGMFLSYE
jgi:5-methylcytosine-specific restriction endonuclease McrA